MSTPDYDELEPEFREVMDLLRGGLPEPSSERPSDDVWDAIATELGPAVAGSGSSAGEAAGADEGSAVAEIRSARSWGRPVAALTAVAAALLVGIPLYLAARGGDGEPSQRAELAAMSGFDGSGQAELDGRALNVRFDGSRAPAGTSYELWLLDVEGEDVEALHWVGRVEVDADGRFDIPDDVDLAEFDVVDVSIEPDDGDPAHSGDSILRGGLTDL